VDDCTTAYLGEAARDAVQLMQEENGPWFDTSSDSSDYDEDEGELARLSAARPPIAVDPEEEKEEPSSSAQQAQQAQDNHQKVLMAALRYSSSQLSAFLPTHSRGACSPFPSLTSLFPVTLIS